MNPEPLAYHNGRFVPRSEVAIGFHDAGFVFGATVTDFVRTYHQRLFRWSFHLARFRRDCIACQIPLNVSDEERTSAAEGLIAHNAALLAPGDELALISFATPGPIGYMAESHESGPPTLVMHTFRLPVERYFRFFEKGVTLEVAGNAAFSSTIPTSAKHRSRLHWYLAEKMVSERNPGAVAVLVDAHGASADTAIGAVLAVVGQTVFCSPQGSVQDSVTVMVLKEACFKLGMGWEETAFDFESLCRSIDPVERGGFADRVTEVLLAGSGFGVVGVSRCGTAISHRDFPWPGPVCQQLQQVWQSLTV